MAIGREKWGHGNSVLEVHRWDDEGFKEMWEFLHYHVRWCHMAIHTVDRLLARDGGEDLTAYCGASPNEVTMGAVGDRTVTDAQREG